jgi:hypothetical protein
MPREPGDVGVLAAVKRVRLVAQRAQEPPLSSEAVLQEITSRYGSFKGLTLQRVKNAEKQLDKDPLRLQLSQRGSAVIERQTQSRDIPAHGGLSQWLIQRDNHLLGQAERLEATARAEILRESEGRFLSGAHERVQKLHAQGQDVKHAVESVKATKRAEALAQRESHRAAWLGELQKRSKQAANGRQAIVSGRQLTSAKKRSRISGMLSKAVGTLGLSKLDHAQREERIHNAKRAEAAEVRAHTTMVRHDTRPQVRQEGRDMFQAQRTAAGIVERERQESDRRKVETERAQRLLDLLPRREDALRSTAIARASRGILAAQRKRAADRVRSQLQAERARVAQLKEQGCAHAVVPLINTQQTSIVAHTRLKTQIVVESVQPVQPPEQPMITTALPGASAKSPVPPTVNPTPSSEHANGPASARSLSPTTQKPQQMEMHGLPPPQGSSCAPMPMAQSSSTAMPDTDVTESVPIHNMDDNIRDMASS